jgi:hypothetical protein
LNISIISTRLEVQRLPNSKGLSISAVATF